MSFEYNFTEESSMKTWIMAVLIVAASVMGGSAIASQDQKPVTVIILFKVLPGMESAFRTAVAQTIVPTRAEKGCISYTFNQSVEDATEFSAVEIWRSQVDIDRHAASAHIKTLTDTTRRMFASGYPILKSYQSFEK